jgi:hypothetical protein
MYFAVDFSYMASVMLRYTPSMPTLLRVYKDVEVCQMLSLHLLNWSLGF